MKANHLLLAVFAATVASVSVALPSFARPATLIAQNSNSRINVRVEPTTTARSPHYGYAGDRVEVLRSVTGGDQYSWDYVRFGSGAQGWIRGDYVRYTEGMARYGILKGQSGDRINIRVKPSTAADSPHYGIQGDVVQLIQQVNSRDGYVWHYVQFPSGAQGWVRGDLVSLADEGGC